MIGAKAGDELRIETDAGLRICRINNVLADDGYSVEVTTGMGIPSAARKDCDAGKTAVRWKESRSPPAIRTS